MQLVWNTEFCCERLPVAFAAGPESRQFWWSPLYSLAVVVAKAFSLYKPSGAVPLKRECLGCHWMSQLWHAFSFFWDQPVEPWGRGREVALRRFLPGRKRRSARPPGRRTHHCHRCMAKTVASESRRTRHALKDGVSLLSAANPLWDCTS